MFIAQFLESRKGPKGGGSSLEIASAQHEVEDACVHAGNAPDHDAVDESAYSSEFCRCATLLVEGDRLNNAAWFQSWEALHSVAPENDNPHGKMKHEQEPDTTERLFTAVLAWVDHSGMLQDVETETLEETRLKPVPFSPKEEKNNVPDWRLVDVLQRVNDRFVTEIKKQKDLEQWRENTFTERLFAKKETEAVIQRWSNCVQKLTQAFRTAVQLHNPREFDGSHELNTRVQKCEFTCAYVRQFLECSRLIRKAQHALYCQHMDRTVHALHEVYLMLSVHCRTDGRWIFQGKSREYLVKKVDFLLRSAVHPVLTRIHDALEHLDFGGHEFFSRFESLSEVEKQRVSTRVTSLEVFQRLHHLLRSLQDDITFEPHQLMTWVGFLLASLPILRFNLLFLHPSSVLCNFVYLEEPTRFMHSVLSTHVGVLLKLTPWEGDTDDAKRIVTCFVRLLCEHLQSFLVGRYKYLRYALQTNKVPSLSSSYMDTFMSKTIDEVLEITALLDALGVDGCEALFLEPTKWNVDVSDLLETSSTKKEYLALFLNNISSEERVGASQLTHVNDDSILSKWFATHDPNSREGSPSQGVHRYSQGRRILFGDLLCDHHQAQLCRYWDLLQEIPLLQPTSVIEAQAMPREPSHHSGVLNHIDQQVNCYSISQRIRLFIEGLATLLHKVAVFLKHPQYAQEYLGWYSGNVKNHIMLFWSAERVVEPVLKIVRGVLRDEWNSLGCSPSQLESCYVILDSCHFIVKYLGDSGHLSLMQYLTAEMGEWRKLLSLAHQMVVNVFIDLMDFPNLNSLLCSIEFDEKSGEVRGMNTGEAWPLFVKKIKENVRVDPGRTTLLYEMGEALGKMILQLVTHPTPLLYIGDRKTLAYHCRCAVQTFQDELRLEKRIEQLKDIEVLLLASDVEVRQFLEALVIVNDTNLAESTMMPVGEDDMSGRQFFGVRLVMEAEKLLKKSTHQMLNRPQIKCSNNLNANSARENEVQTGKGRTKSNLGSKIIRLTYKQCYTILRKRREFAFSISPGFVAEEPIC